jgi:alginate O-acetyltransferase complex protein AlgI
MLFTSTTFLVFSLLFFSVYFCLRGRSQHGWLLGASVVFYGWWDWRFLFLLIGITLWNYYLGILLGGEQAALHRKKLLVAGIIGNLFPLFLFKYYNFFTESLQSAIAWILPGFEIDWSLRLLLPIGISFYTFQAMSYILDIYRRKMTVEPSLLRFACFPPVTSAQEHKSSRLCCY